MLCRRPLSLVCMRICSLLGQRPQTSPTLRPRFPNWRGNLMKRSRAAVLNLWVVTSSGGRASDILKAFMSKSSRRHPANSKCPDYRHTTTPSSTIFALNLLDRQSTRLEGGACCCLHWLPQENHGHLPGSQTTSSSPGATGTRLGALTLKS